MALNNQSWSQAIIATLFAQGVRHFCVAPGSRSAPLSLAVFARQTDAEGDLVKIHTHFDERGLGFFALNLAKATLQPVVVICTSGTAVANLHPAVIEAWESQVPLIVLSADRPDALHNCGANQAIAQKALFGGQVNCSANFTLPDTEQELTEQLQRLSSCCNALAPSQINCQFDEPLYPGEKRAGNTAIPLQQLPRQDALKKLEHCAQNSERTLIILGALSANAATLIQAWLQAGSALVFADINSQYKFGELSGKLHYYDLCLLNSEFVNNFKPQLIIQIGGRLVSKRLNAWLANNPVDYFLLNSTDRDLDPTHQAQRITAELSEVNELVSGAFLRWRDREFLLQADRFLNDSIGTALQTQWSEPAVCVQLAKLLCDEHALFIGNSLAIRMFDSWLPVLQQRPVIFSNRGASGIDGLVASCAALAHADFSQVFAVLGDTSVLHDLNSLALLREPAVAVKVVVLNNNGGRIFSLLPAAQQAAFEPLFAMPHDLTFQSAAELFGLRYFHAEGWQSLPGALESFVAHDGSAILECSITKNSGISHIQALMAGLKCHQLQSHI